MANALAINGAQSEKQVKFAAMYVGRIFSGIWTNRSPLRDAHTNRIEEKYYGPCGDAMIAGSNVEVTNRLTLSRRPGNPQYDSINSYSNILAFDEFRYSKALSDAWGVATEQIDVMVDTQLGLYANNNGTSTLVQTKLSGAGQSFMQEVGTQLYFSDSLDQKKWNQSLFVRNASNNGLGLNIAAYPFMNTNTVDTNGNIQQLIGTLIATINTVAITGNVLSITLDAPLGAPHGTIAAGMFDNPGGKQDKGTNFVLWGFQGTAAAFLNGLTVTLATQSGTNAMTLTCDYNHATLASTAVTGYLQIQNGVVSGVANALNSSVAITATMPAAVTLSAPGLTVGTTVPTWGTTVPSATNDFQGSFTIDGDAIWVNRGTPTENWGIVAPTLVPTLAANGEISGYVPNTYFSPASIYQDPTGYLWQITTPGILSSTSNALFAWPATPTVATKTNVVSIAISSSTGVITVTVANNTLFTLGSIVTMLGLEPSSFLNGVPLTVTSGTATALTFTAAYPYPTDYTATEVSGYTFSGGTTVADGTAIWTAIQTPTLTNSWQPDYAYVAGTYIKAPNGTGGQPAYWLLRTNQGTAGIGQPTIHNVGGSPILYGYNSIGVNYNVSLTTALAASPAETIPWQSGGAPNHISSLLWNYYHYSNNYLHSTPISGNDVVGTEYQIEETTCHTFIAIIPITIPSAGTYTFNLAHPDGALYAFQNDNGVGGTAVKNTGTFSPAPGEASATIKNSYPNPCGTNNFTSAPATGNVTNDTSTWTFSAPGVYMLEIDFLCVQANEQSVDFTCNSLNIASEPQISNDASGPNTAIPAWSEFLPAGTTATYNAAQDEIYFAQTASDAGGQFIWNNIGLVSTFVRIPGIMYTLPGQKIVDTFSDEEGAYQTGYTGTTAPAWSTAPNTVVLDPNTPLSWINEGAVPIPALAAGKITALSTQGWLWAIALVNTLDNTVSNIGPLSAASGPLVNASPSFAPGAGLSTSLIDPQVDYVAIFRTADGFPTELLIPNFGNTIYTVPLSQYLLNGYVDTTQDVDLDTSATAPAAFENTPPLPGAVNLVYHLNRIFYSTGNTVFWTSGPNDPIGNGINGFAPNNYDTMPSTVKRLVPTSLGLLVFTVSDIYLIGSNNGTILPSVIWVQGIGISSYNALDYNGPSIGFFTTDSQFLTITPQAGMVTDSVPIADQLVLKNGTPGKNWYSAKVYVAHYVNGSDMGWFLSDGATGWYRLITNKAPESGSMCWSPFAAIVGGVGAIKSVEVAPGDHRLLLAPAVGTHTITTNGLAASTHLATANNYAVLAYSAVTGSAGAGSVVTGGNVGISPTAITAITEFPPSTVTAPNVIEGPDTATAQAQVDLAAAIIYWGTTYPATLGGATVVAADNLSTGGNGSTAATWKAGAYSGGALDMPTSITLDAQGNPDAIFVFIASSTIKLESGASVILANGAQAANVYWVVGSSFTSIWNGTSSNMVGNILAHTSISLGGGNLNGRALANTGAVTMATTETITVPTATTTTTTSGYIMNRNILATTDNGTTGSNGSVYPAYAVFGSYVLAQPGQVALVAFITTKSVKVGSPIVLGLLIDEALPYYMGSVEILKNWVNDPPTLKPSKSFYAQRFYLSDMPDTAAACTDIQIMVQWPAEAALNELQTFTVFGAYSQEQ